jgi:hypothetical protein
MDFVLTFRFPVASAFELAAFRSVYGSTSGLKTLSEAGTDLVVPAVTRAITGITYSVSRLEDSREMTFTGGDLGGNLSCFVRDVTQLWTPGYRTGEDSSKYYPRFAGFLAVTPSPFAPLGVAGEYKVVGLSELLKRTRTNPLDGSATVYPADLDLGYIALDIAYRTLAPAQGNQAPAIILPPPIVGAGNGDWECLVNNAGPVNPGRKNLYECFQALTALYLQSGTEPAPEVYVTPDRRLQWLPPNTDALTVTEGTACAVTWPPIAGELEHYVTGVQWVLGKGDAAFSLLGADLSTGPVGKVDYATEDPITHFSDSLVRTFGEGTLELTPSDAIPWAEPVSDLAATVTAGSISASYSGGVADGTPSAARITDGDPTSYSVLTGSTVEITLTSATLQALTAGEIVAIELDMKPNASMGAVSDGQYVYCSVMTYAGAFVGALHPVPVRDGNGGAVTISKTVWLGDRARSFGGDTVFGAGGKIVVSLAVGGSGSLPSLVYDVGTIRVYRLAADVLDGAAKLEYRLPNLAALSATVRGEVTPEPFLNVTRADATTPASLQGLKVSEYVVDVEAGETTVRVGPRVDSFAALEQNTQAARVTALAQKSVTDAVRRAS